METYSNNMSAGKVLIKPWLNTSSGDQNKEEVAKKSTEVPSKQPAEESKE